MQFQSHTSELLRSFHSERDCNESGTNGIAVLSSARCSISNEVAPKAASESREVFPDLWMKILCRKPEILRLQVRPVNRAAL